MKKKFQVYGSIYIGKYEASTKEEAMEMAEKDASASFCHQCSDQCEDACVEVTEAIEDIDD